LSRIDPQTDRVLAKTIRLPISPWDLAVGIGSVWVTENGGGGSLLRIDAHTGRIQARIVARPIYLGGELITGGGYVWTGNDDERYRGGSTVSKLDPSTNRIVGKPLALGSPQSMAFGFGALWIADHTGWLIKIDPVRFRVVARQRLDFGPHGVTIAGSAVYVADAHGARLLEADPRTAKIRRVTRLDVGPIYPAAAAGSLWSGSAIVWKDPSIRDDRVVRIDLLTLKITEILHLGGSVPSLASGFGSIWAAVATGEVIRITPR
jgi:hypothetical protein